MSKTKPMNLSSAFVAGMARVAESKVTIAPANPYSAIHSRLREIRIASDTLTKQLGELTCEVMEAEVAAAQARLNTSGANL